MAVVSLKLSHFHILIHLYYNICGFVFTLFFMHGIKNPSGFLYYVLKKKKKAASYQSCIWTSKQGALRLVKHPPTPLEESLEPDSPMVLPTGKLLWLQTAQFPKAQKVLEGH